MADKRNIRRDAERKAREALGGDLVTTVGDLAMATADRTAATQSVTQARTRGNELMAAAQQQADKLVAAAQHGLDSIEEQYSNHYTAAREAGWTTTQLRALGYPRPATGKAGPGRDMNGTDTDAKRSEASPAPTAEPATKPAMSAAS